MKLSNIVVLAAFALLSTACTITGHNPLFTQQPTVEVTPTPAVEIDNEYDGVTDPTDNDSDGVTDDPTPPLLTVEYTVEAKKLGSPAFDSTLRLTVECQVGGFSLSSEKSVKVEQAEGVAHIEVSLPLYGDLGNEAQCQIMAGFGSPGAGAFLAGGVTTVHVRNPNTGEEETAADVCSGPEYIDLPFVRLDWTKGYGDGIIVPPCD